MNTSTLPLHLIGTDFTDDEYDICDHGSNMADPHSHCNECELDLEGEEFGEDEEWIRLDPRGYEEHHYGPTGLIPEL